MTAQLTWAVDSLTVMPQVDGQTNVVSVIGWRLTAVDGDVVASVYGTQNLAFDGQTQFTPYEYLTQDTVIGWLKDALGSDQVAMYETAMLGRLQSKIDPPVMEKPLPWSEASV